MSETKGFDMACFFDLPKREGERTVKKAMLTVSFGTTHDDAEASCIRPVEEALHRAFPEWNVYRAWTSRLIQKKLQERTKEDEDAIGKMYYNNGYVMLQLNPVESKL